MTLGKPEGDDYPSEEKGAKNCQAIAFKNRHDLGRVWIAVTEGLLIERSARQIVHSPQRQPRDRGCLFYRILLLAHGNQEPSRPFTQLSPRLQSSQLPHSAQRKGQGPAISSGGCHFHGLSCGNISKNLHPGMTTVKRMSPVRQNKTAMQTIYQGENVRCSTSAIPWGGKE